jgi:hypothetical protein
VVWNESPGKAGCFRLNDNAPEMIQKVVPLIVVTENLATLCSPYDDVMQCTGGIYAGFSGHKTSLAQTEIEVIQ